MATIKAYIDLEQSKKLAEFLPLESADMVYFGIHRGIDGKYHLSGTNTEDDVIPIYKNLCTKVFVKITSSDIACQLPCWSLAALLDVLQESIIDDKHELIAYMSIYKYDSLWVCAYDYENQEDGNYISFSKESLIDACYEMIEHLHELKML